MSFVLEFNWVEDVLLGSQWGFEGAQLRVDQAAIIQRLRKAEPNIRAARVHRVRPGESTRIYCCKDVVQPTIKTSGECPGLGRRRVLENLAVVTCGPIVGFQEGIIDMTGPGATYSPFSQMNLLAVEIEVAAPISAAAHEAILRRVGVDVAEMLAEAAASLPPDREQTIAWPGSKLDAALPRVAYIAMVLSQGLLHDTWVLGENARSALPKIIEPSIICDAGIVSGNCVSACDKNTSFHHRNNPIIDRLLKGHGREWNFTGVVLTNQPIRLADKERSAREAVALARSIAPDGVIVSKEGFGNPDSDFMMIIRMLEQAGIKVVGITDEFAGVDGASQSLADSVPEAVAIVSTGNANERLLLPAMERSIGSVPDASRLAGGYAGSLKADGQLEIELQMIMGATNELGFSMLSARTI